MFSGLTGYYCMGNVKIFLRGENLEWRRVGHLLKENGFDVRNTKADADVSVVLGGRGINTLALTGKKVLVYGAGEWLRGVPIPRGFNLFKPVLEEYYDDFLDVTGMEIHAVVDKIIKYIGGL